MCPSKPRPDDDRATLVALLARWQRSPDRRLAELIERVGARAAHALAAPTSEDDWLAMVERRDPVERQRLVATVREGNVTARLAALCASADDPRIDRVLLDFCCSGKTWLSNHRPLFDRVCTMRDPRVRDRLDELERVLAANRRVAWKRYMAAVRKAHAGPEPELPPDERAAVEAQLAALAPPPARDATTEAALIAAIYADPQSDGPREVYADWLLERGEPRGEYIMLALAEARGTLTAEKADRLDDLERAYQATWFPSLASHSAARFGRGFLTSIYVADRDDPLAHDPVLATLEKARAIWPGMGEARALKELLETSPEDLDAIAAFRAPPPIELVDLEATPEIAARFPRVALPALRRVQLSGEGITAATLGWLLPGRRIEELEISSYGDLPLAAITLAAEPTTVRSIYWKGRVDWRIARDDRGRLAHLTLRLHAAKLRDLFDTIVATIAAFPDGALSAFAIENTPRYSWERVKTLRWTKAMRAAFTTQWARHPGIATTLPDF